MKQIYRLVILTVVLLATLSCTPRIFFIDVEVKQPLTTKQIELNDKRFAIFFNIEDANYRDSVFLSEIAMSMAAHIEAEVDIQMDYVPVFLTREALGFEDMKQVLEEQGVFDIEYMIQIDSNRFGDYEWQGADYLNREYKVDYYSVHFLREYSYKVNLYKSATPFAGYLDELLFEFNIVTRDRNTIRDEISSEVDLLVPVYVSGGKEIANQLLPVWKMEQRQIYVLENNTKWTTAYKLASGFKWEAARTSWINMMSDEEIMNNAVHRSCIASNIAVACEMLQDHDLAIEWLDVSDKLYKLSTTPGIRTAVVLKYWEDFK